MQRIEQNAERYLLVTQEAGDAMQNPPRCDYVGVTNKHYLVGRHLSPEPITREFKRRRWVIWLIQIEQMDIWGRRASKSLRIGFGSPVM